MKNILSLVTLTAGAFSFAVFLTTLPSHGAPRESGFNPSAAAAIHASGGGCRLYGPLLADSRHGGGILFRLRNV